MCASAKKTSVMPGDEVVENRSCLWLFAHRYSGFRSFFHKKMHVTEKMAGVLAIYVGKCSDVSQATMGGRETHMKAAHQVERNVWLSSTVEHFEGIVRNARKKGILYGTTLWSLAALIWVPWRLSRCLICTQIFLASDPFFVDPCRKFFGFQIRSLMCAPRHVGFSSFFSKKYFAHRKTSTTPDNVNNTNTMTKNLCRCFF